MSVRMIKNFNKLATTPLRKETLEIVEADYRVYQENLPMVRRKI